MAHLSRAPLEPSLARIARSCLPARDRAEAYALLEDGITPEQLVVEGSCCADATAGRFSGDKVELLHASFNRLVFSAQAGRAGLLSMKHPFSSRWRATVNDKETLVCRANGIAHAVAIPVGTSRVEFRYHDPAAAWGMGLTCCGLGFLALWMFPLARVPWGKAAALCLAVLAAAMFPLWRASLYNGRGLETKYSWTRPQAAEQNLAYLKRTSASSTSFPRIPAPVRERPGVDGDTNAGFTTGRGGALVGRGPRQDP